MILNLSHVTALALTPLRLDLSISIFTLPSLPCILGHSYEEPTDHNRRYRQPHTEIQRRAVAARWRGAMLVGMYLDNTSKAKTKTRRIQLQSTNQ